MVTSHIIGFDLDMTLIDSRSAILASFEAIERETGISINLAEVDSRLGIKLRAELAYWMPAEMIESAVDIYRRSYTEVGDSLTTVLPGARESLSAVRQTGNEAVVISAKIEPVARRALSGAELAVDKVYGGVHGPEKGKVLADISAAIYVGDTPADMKAAIQAHAYAVGVATGSFNVDDLQKAGANICFTSLADFPDWYTEYFVRPTNCRSTTFL